MRGSPCRLIVRTTALALCATAAVGAGALQAHGEDPVGQHASTTSTAAPFIEPRPGEALPDWPLEDGHGRRFRLSETRGKPVVLVFGFAELKWDQGARALRMIAGHRDRAEFFHLSVVPSIHTEDAPGAPLVPAWDHAQQHRENTAWLSGVGEDPGRSVRRLPRGPGDGPRPWRLRDSRLPWLVISDADGVVQQFILRDTATEAQVNGFVLLDAAITCAGGGPPMYEDTQALVASGRLAACSPSERSSGEPPSMRRGQSPAAASPAPSPSR